MTDVSPDVLARLTPATLIFHWKTATAYTLLLAIAVVWLFLSLHRYPATFASDHFQANVRSACIIPLLIFCFISIAFQRLAPFGLMPSVVLLGTALTLWMDTAAASLFYGMIDGRGPEWINTHSD